jgi:hypothetical protein
MQRLTLVQSTNIFLSSSVMPVNAYVSVPDEPEPDPDPPSVDPPLVLDPEPSPEPELVPEPEPSSVPEPELSPGVSSVPEPLLSVEPDSSAMHPSSLLAFLAYFTFAL